MPDNVPITAGVGTNIATDDMGAYGHVQRVKRQAGGDGTSVDLLDNATRSDTFTATGTGTVFSVAAQAIKRFSLLVKGTGGAPTAISVALEISIDGTNFSPILLAGTAEEIPTADGQTISTGANCYPALHFRSRVVSITLSPATNVVVTICGMR